MPFAIFLKPTPMHESTKVIEPSSVLILYTGGSSHSEKHTSAAAHKCNRARAELSPTPKISRSNRKSLIVAGVSLPAVPT
jgi:hypothetical protein